jgi:quercetin dioxygenase-like cupin family protein/predicted GNAT family N-acyltransferase
MKISPQNAEHYSWGKNCDGWHLLKSGSLSVIEERMPPGAEEQLHCHRFSQQLFYMLSGTAFFEAGALSQELSAGESIHVSPGTLHRIANRQKEELRFLLISQPQAQGDRIEIAEYSPEMKAHIKRLNVEWLEKYFRVEESDHVQLNDPGKEIRDKGGLMFFAKYREEVVGTASLLKMEEDVYELGKMAVTESAQGLGIGKVLMEHALNLARKLRLKKLVLYSNTSLGPAIHLYKKYGFSEVKLEAGHYERANIKMEKIF